MRKIINTHDQLTAAGGGIAIVRSHSLGRDQHFYGWAIYRVNASGQQVVTNPKAAWYDHGKKVFPAFDHPGGKKGALADAKQWVADQFGETGPWTRNWLYDYVPTRIYKAWPQGKDYEVKP